MKPQTAQALSQPSAIPAASRGAGRLRHALCVLMACTGLAVLSAPASAQLQETRYLFANSHCRHPIRIMVMHKDSANPHHVHAWYVFRPYQESRLEDNNVVLRQIVGADLYYYAETVEGPGVPSLVWRGNDATGTYQNVNYPMRRATLTVNARGELEFGFRCEP